MNRLYATSVKTCLAMLVVLFGNGQANGQANGQPSSDFDNVRIQLLNGSSIRCSIDSIDEQGNVTGPNVPTGLKLNQIVKLRCRERSLAKSNEFHRLLVVGGSTLWVKNLAVDEDTAIFQSLIDLNRLKLELVRAVIWNETDRVRDNVDNPSPGNDRIVVQTDKGERVVEGLLERIDGTHVVLNFKGKSRRVSLAIANAVVSADLDLRSPVGPVADVQLRDGSNIKGRVVRLIQGELTIELPGRNQIQISTTYVAELNIQSENLVYLSDLQPVSIQQQTLFVVQRSWQRDRSVQGAPLTLGFSEATQKVATFQKGIGTQSYSRLAFANEKDYDRFRAVVGIDTETSGRGDCICIVMGDGVRLWSRRIQASDDPVSVSVDITGMAEITLIVEPGEQLDLGDHANWAMARFTKSQ